MWKKALAGIGKGHGLLLLCALMLLAPWGCSEAPSSCLNTTLMSTEVDDTGLVTMFFRIDCDGDSVTGLNEANFTIIENGAPISAFESQAKVASTSQAAGSVFISYTMLLLDMSGSIVDSNNLQGLIDASKLFVRTTAKPGQKVGIFLFDGRAFIEELVPFTSDKDELNEALLSLENYEIVDRSTNLNGAVINAVERLQSVQQYEEDALLTAGTLVIFTDGTDRAQRFVGPEAQEAAQDAAKQGMSIYTVGLGVEVDQAELILLGPSGFEYAQDASAIIEAFGKISDRIARLNSGYYGLAFCSSARGGQQHLTVQIQFDGQEVSLQTTFDADTFGLGCNTDRTSAAVEGAGGSSADETDTTGTDTTGTDTTDPVIP